MGTKTTLPRAGRGVSATEQSETTGVIRRGPLAGLARRPKANPKRHLTERHLRRLINAKAFAETLPVLMVTGIDILWIHAQCLRDDAGNLRTDQMPKQMARLLERVRKEMAKHGLPLHYIYVWEKGRTKKQHVHMLWTVPVALIGRIDRLIRRLFDFGYAANALHWATGGAKNSRGRDLGYGLNTTRMRGGRFSYMLKGYDAENFRYFGYDREGIGDLLGLRHRNGGVIPWQRCSVSRSLDASARRKAGWSDIRSWEVLAGHLHTRPAAKAGQGTASARGYHADRRRTGGAPARGSARSTARGRLQSARGRSR